MQDAWIFDAVRTPRGRGKAGGGLNTVAPIALARTTLQAVRDRNALDTSLVDDVYLGIVEPVNEQGSNLARVAVIYSGYDQSVPGVQINRYCASGLAAVNMAAAQVMAGQARMAIGGGVESMSRVPMGSSRGAWATDPQVSIYTKFVPQGVSADLIATKWGYTRAHCDEIAVMSQQRAATAWAEGRFDKSIIPVKDDNGMTLLARDEHMRPDATVAGLGKLEPAFLQMGESYGFDAVAQQRYPDIEKIHHVHHAGNSSGIVDGSAAVLIGRGDVGDAHGLKRRARIRSFASIGSEPTIMLTGPSLAVDRALKLAGLQVSDIDLWEINEAFASVVLRFKDALGLDMDRVNVNGGAIAMGHPLGATGAMILGTLLDEMERRDLRFGCASLCVGAGMGIATIIERVDA